MEGAVVPAIVPEIEDEVTIEVIGTIGGIGETIEIEIVTGTTEIEEATEIADEDRTVTGTANVLAMIEIEVADKPWLQGNTRST